MPDTAGCSLRGLAYSLGTLVPVLELRGAGIAEGELDSVLSWGMRTCAVSRADEAQLARESIQRTLQRCRVAPQELQAVIYATSYLDEAQFYAVHQVLADLEICKATPIAVSLGGCSNIAAALRVARSLIVSQECESVLVVSVERCRVESRVLREGACVLSDAAASTIVGPAGQGDYDLQGLCLRADNGLAARRPSDGDASAWTLNMMAGFRATIRDLCRTTGYAPRSYARFVTNNYSESVLRPLVSLCGFTSDQAYFDNIGRIGHAFSADVLINLRDLEDQGQISTTGPLLLASTSNGAWSAITLRATPTPHPKDR